MAVSFNQDKVWSLRPMSIDNVRSEVSGLLIGGEEIVEAYRTIRDQLVFTNKRIISVDVQGVGKKKSYSSLPYSKIQYFAVQTPGFGEVFVDAELYVTFVGGFSATFEFRDSADMGKIARLISERVL